MLPEKDDPDTFVRSQGLEVFGDPILRSEAVLVLYDGVCGLCNRTVQFALKRDRRDLFRFAPLQGELAQGLLSRHGLSAKDLDTVYVVEDHSQPGEKVAKKSRAVPLMTTRGFPTALIRGRPAALPSTYTSPPFAPYMKVCPTSP